MDCKSVTIQNLKEEKEYVCDGKEDKQRRR